MNGLLRQTITVLATLAVIAVNAAADTLPINGRTTGEISDSFSVYFVPAGYVFSIWGLIYVALIAFSIYQALPSKRHDAVLRQVDYLYVVSCAANIAWIFLWHYGQYEATIAAMAILLLSLLAIYLRLDIGRTHATGYGHWLSHVPFSIYLGWITVATIANASVVLVYVGWNGWGIAPEVWTVVMLAVAVGLAWAMRLARHDVAYLAGLVWAFVGLAIKQSAQPVVFVAAIVATGLVAIALLDAARVSYYGQHERPVSG